MALGFCISFLLKGKIWEQALTVLLCSWNNFLCNDSIKINEIKWGAKKKNQPNATVSSTAVGAAGSELRSHHLGPVLENILELSLYICHP